MPARALAATSSPQLQCEPLAGIGVALHSVGEVPFPLA